MSTIVRTKPRSVQIGSTGVGGVDRLSIKEDIEFLYSEIQSNQDEDNSALAALEGRLNGSIADEAAARQAADDALNGRIDQEISDRQSADSQESSARVAADDALGARIDDEITNRENAVQAVENALATETSARELLDTTLRGLISDEATARALADSVITDTINANDASSLSRDNELMGYVAGLVAGNFSLHKTVVVSSMMPSDGESAAPFELATSMPAAVGDQITAGRAEGEAVISELNSKTSEKSAAQSTLTARSSELTSATNAKTTAESNVTVAEGAKTSAESAEVAAASAKAAAYTAKGEALTVSQEAAAAASVADENMALSEIARNDAQGAVDAFVAPGSDYTVATADVASKQAVVDAVYVQIEAINTDLAGRSEASETSAVATATQNLRNAAELDNMFGESYFSRKISYLTKLAQKNAAEAAEVVDEALVASLTSQLSAIQTWLTESFFSTMPDGSGTGNVTSTGWDLFTIERDVLGGDAAALEKYNALAVIGLPVLKQTWYLATGEAKSLAYDLGLVIWMGPQAASFLLTAGAAYYPQIQLQVSYFNTATENLAAAQASLEAVTGLLNQMVVATGDLESAQALLVAAQGVLSPLTAQLATLNEALSAAEAALVDATQALEAAMAYAAEKKHLDDLARAAFASAEAAHNAASELVQTTSSALLEAQDALATATGNYNSALVARDEAQSAYDLAASAWDVAKAAWDILVASGGPASLVDDLVDSVLAIYVNGIRMKHSFVDAFGDFEVIAPDTVQFHFDLMADDVVAYDMWSFADNGSVGTPRVASWVPGEGSEGGGGGAVPV